MDHGLLLLDKRSGITSAKAIAEVKRRLSLTKIGHSGTLDPMATGLLVCLTGNATRCAQYAVEGEKIYSGKILLGRVTTTDDVTGETISSTAVSEEARLAAAAAKTFEGEIQQLPPQFSALKVGGRRAYDLARDGEKVDLKHRSVTIKSFEVAEGDDPTELTFRAVCSPGTYIRSIARDLGEKLGVGACLSALRREASAPFSVNDAKLIDDITPSDILPWSALFPRSLFVPMSAEMGSRLKGGDQRELPQYEKYCTDAQDNQPILFGSEESAVGVLLKKEGKLTLGVYIG